MQPTDLIIYLFKWHLTEQNFFARNARDKELKFFFFFYKTIAESTRYYFIGSKPRKKSLAGTTPLPLMTELSVKDYIISINNEI